MTKKEFEETILLAMSNKCPSVGRWVNYSCIRIEDSYNFLRNQEESETGNNMIDLYEDIILNEDTVGTYDINNIGGEGFTPLRQDMLNLFKEYVISEVLYEQL